MRHGFVQVPGAEVHYREAGEGPPLVLLHGLAASWRWWRPVLDVLTRHHRVLAFDLPGFGETRAERRFSLKSAGTFVCQVMGALGLERVDLVGHSLGGRIAMDVAAHCPERVERLVLVSAVGLSWRKPYPMVGLDLLLEGWLNAPRYPDLVREDARRVGFLELCLATYEVLADDFRAAMARIQAPTLVVWGDRDILTPPRHAEILAGEIPSAALAFIRGAGHTPWWDAPEEFSELVLDFLARDQLAARESRRVGADACSHAPLVAALGAATDLPLSHARSERRPGVAAVGAGRGEFGAVEGAVEAAEECLEFVRQQERLERIA